MAVVISQKMDVDLEAGTITITDTSTYGAEVCVGVISMQSPTGAIIYSNTDFDTPDIESNGGSFTLPVPLDADGDMVAGIYTVSMTLKDDTDVEYVNETEYDFDYVAPVVSITQTPDGYASTFRSIDTTDYSGFTISRTHEVVVPAGSGMVDYSETTATVSIPANIWSGEYTTDISTDLTYTNGLLTVIDTVTGSESVTVYKVDRETVYNAVEAFTSTYNTLLGTNPTLASTYDNLMLRAVSYQAEYDNAVDTGNTRKAYEALVNISELLSPDFIETLFVTTEEITPFSIAYELDHTHSNLSVLALLTAVGEELYYNGNPVVSATSGQVKTDADDTLQFLGDKVDDTTIGVDGNKKLEIKETYPASIIDNDWIIQSAGKLTVDPDKVTALVGDSKSFQIILSAGASVAARVVGVDTVVPSGWSVAAVNTYDLEITHTALGKNLAFVNIWSKSGSTYSLLMGSSAYTGLTTNATTNVSIIQSLATYNTILKIDLIFI